MYYIYKDKHGYTFFDIKCDDFPYTFTIPSLQPIPIHYDIIPLDALAGLNNADDSLYRYAEFRFRTEDAMLEWLLTN